MSRRNPAILLASASPRRRDLLEQVGFSVVVRPVDADEVFAPGASAVEEALRIARAKAALAPRDPTTVAGITADTVVWLESHNPLGKPRDRSHAFEMLRSLAGNVHTVTTAFAVTSPLNGELLACEAVHTRVRFRPLADRDIEAYLETREPWDKAGAYAIQGLAGLFVDGIDGSFTNVVGLPVSDVVAALRRLGLLAGWPWEVSS